MTTAPFNSLHKNKVFSPKIGIKMIVQVIKFDIKPTHIALFKALLEDDKQGSKNEAGLLEMRLYQDKNLPNIFFAYERFDNQSAIDHHSTQQYTKALLDALPTISEKAPEIFYLNGTTPAPLFEKNPKTVNTEDELFIMFCILKIDTHYKAELLTQFKDHITQTRQQEQGNLLFDLYTVENQEDTLVIYEHWRKESDLWDIHFSQPYVIETAKLMEKAVIGEIKQYMSFVTEI